MRLRRALLQPIMSRSARFICLLSAIFYFNHVAAQSSRTPEQERSEMISAIQKRLPGTRPEDWEIGGVGFETGVKTTALSADNATNTADIFAIGKKTWDRPFKNGKNFASCFPNGGKRVATTYPQFDINSKLIVTLEMALNRCMVQHGEAPIDATDANVMGPLSAYLRSLSEGQKLSVKVATQPARDRFDAGRRFFHQRIGQQNYACASCHVQYAGAVYGEAGLSPAVGQTVTYPRLQPGGTIRTLHAQFQRCMQRSGAEPFAVGADEFSNLEYYLSFLSNGLPLRPLATAP
jgi:L-cysteine S-thiosulfotransferase